MFFQWERKTLIRNDEFISLSMTGNNYNDTAMNISRRGNVKLSVVYFYNC